MPQGDRTGPEGQGSMTGRAMGSCAGFNTPGFVNPRFARGLGRGRGFGRRAIQMQQPQLVITEKQEKELLEQELKAIKEEQAEIEAHLKKLK